MSDERTIIHARLKLLDDYTRKLHELQATDLREYVANYFIHKTTERLFETAIQACLDIGRHLIADRGFRLPEDNKEVFRVLAEEEVIPTRLLSHLEAMAGFRNILVHEYANLDNRKVYRNLQENLNDFDEFARAIVKYLERTSSASKAARERRARYTTSRTRKSKRT